MHRAWIFGLLLVGCSGSVKSGAASITGLDGLSAQSALTESSSAVVGDGGETPRVHVTFFSKTDVTCDDLASAQSATSVAQIDIGPIPSSGVPTGTIPFGDAIGATTTADFATLSLPLVVSTAGSLNVTSAASGVQGNFTATVALPDGGSQSISGTFDAPSCDSALGIKPAGSK